jgi:hypothetical protein
MKHKLYKAYFLGFILAFVETVAAQDADPLPSWNDGASKLAITRFVQKVGTTSSAGFVTPAERIAVFDNDGTLWSEQPMYFQLAFALDRVRALAPLHPEWKQEQPFKAVLECDLKTVCPAVNTRCLSSSWQHTQVRRQKNSRKL